MFEITSSGPQWRSFGLLFLVGLFKFSHRVTGFKQDLGTDKKFLFCLVSLQNIWPDVSGIAGMFFLAEVKRVFALILHLELSYGAIFAESLVLIVVQWTLTSNSGFFCTFLEKSRMSSWTDFVKFFSQFWGDVHGVGSRFFRLWLDVMLFEVFLL